MIYSNDQQVRHVHLDEPHSAHYQGDTLVVDTIGLNDKTFVDNFRTPHTEKLHVVERFRLVDGGKVMQVDITFDDPDDFNAPWSVMQHYDRIQQPMDEQICAENNLQFFQIPGGEQAGFLSGAALRDQRVW